MKAKTRAPDDLARAVGKAARRLLPFLLLLYILAFLDRANVGFAKQTFLHDTGLSEAAYAFGAGVFFLGHALLEVSSNLILHRVGARAWMCRIMVSPGLRWRRCAWLRRGSSPCSRSFGHSRWRNWRARRRPGALP